MKRWGTTIVVLATLFFGLTSVQAGGPTQVAPPAYGDSGHWEVPVPSPLCHDTQRCAEWHDDTDGFGPPRTLCCVEAIHLQRNDYRDCVRAFRNEGRDD